MKNLCIIASCCFLLLSCGGMERGERSLEEISRQDLVAALNERDQLLSIVSEVSAGMEEIKQLEDIMTISTRRPTENTSGRRTQLLADISRLKEKIRQRKARLDELEKKLRDSAVNTSECLKTITALRALIDAQMAEIESLNRQLTAANEHIGRLSIAVDSLNPTARTVEGERNEARRSSASYEETSVRLGNKLNTCYFVVATKSDLRKHDIIESRFLRKTRLMKGDFDKGFFVTGDKRTLTALPLKASKVRILTNHPAGSYQIVDEEGEKVLRITDRDAFWSLTNYLVVQKD